MNAEAELLWPGVALLLLLGAVASLCVRCSRPGKGGIVMSAMEKTVCPGTLAGPNLAAVGRGTQISLTGVTPPRSAPNCPRTQSVWLTVGLCFCWVKGCVWGRGLLWTREGRLGCLGRPPSLRPTLLNKQCETPCQCQLAHSDWQGTGHRADRMKGASGLSSHPDSGHLLTWSRSCRYEAV